MSDSTKTSSASGAPKNSPAPPADPNTGGMLGDKADDVQKPRLYFLKASALAFTELVTLWVGGRFSHQSFLQSLADPQVIGSATYADGTVAALDEAAVNTPLHSSRTDYASGISVARRFSFHHNTVGKREVSYFSPCTDASEAAEGGAAGGEGGRESSAEKPTDWQWRATAKQQTQKTRGAWTAARTCRRWPTWGSRGWRSSCCRARRRGSRAVCTRVCSWGT